VSVFSAFPRCVIEIYPYEGGFYEIVSLGGHLLSCRVGKPVSGAPGGFTLKLAPNGPGASTNAAVPDWTQVITPMSLVLIGMQRWQYSQIVLVGVVTNVTTTQDWTNNGQVVRTITITGQDFSAFFDSFTWSILGFQAIFGSSAIGTGLTGNEASGVPASLGPGLLGGTSATDSNPAIIGQNWYTKVMAGTGGILSKTKMMYNGTLIGFPATVSTVFETYPDVFIPFFDNFLSAQGNWTQKFRSIFPGPWYEFFVTTAPLGYYGAGSFKGKPFTMAALPGAPPAGPVVVARVNPLPRLTAKSQGAGLPFTLTGIDAARWNALPLFTLDQHGFLAATLGFSADDVRNAYALNPLQIRAMFGGNNTNTSIFFYSYCGAVDVASIHRYGYRPEVTATEWMGDPTGSAGANQQLDIPQTIATLLCQVISQYQPSPLMAAGSTTIPLRPDILPGTRFEFSPFRGQAPWTFYVESVEHDFVYSGNSVTSLTLSRGMPSAVYADMSQKGVFYAALTGAAERQEGQYAILSRTLNDVGLVIYGSDPGPLAALAASIAPAFTGAQTP
jgi:hypothetical protein